MSRHNGLPGYDAWKTRSDLDDGADNFPDERLISQCDCCGEMKPDCEDMRAYGLDCHVCPKCRGDDQ